VLNPYVAGSIIAVILVVLLFHSLSRKKRLKVIVLRHGQRAEEYRAWEDDTYVYWYTRTGERRTLHKCLKVTMPRAFLGPFGVVYKFLVREDFNKTLPFVTASETTVSYRDAILKLKSLLPEKVRRVKLKIPLRGDKFEEIPLEKYLDEMPHNVVIPWAMDDTLMGSYTEAEAEMLNREFLKAAGAEMRKVPRGQWFIAFILGMAIAFALALAMAQAGWLGRERIVREVVKEIIAWRWL